MNSQKPRINITIPTYNRAYCIDQAIRASLNQTYDNISVTVVDDGSVDNTFEIVEKYFNDPRFCYIQLGKNVGTAQAKNVSILLSDYDAITFHDSDDIPFENKILLQARAMFYTNPQIDDVLNWNLTGHVAGEKAQIDLVVHAHEMIKIDGSVHLIDKQLSLVDDFFPNLQFPFKTEGDWILINLGLFRKEIFETLGGYLESVEEDRELRNRVIGSGYMVSYINKPLLTKIEMGVSLTTDAQTGYKGTTRKKDRSVVWDRIEFMKYCTDIEMVRKKLQVPIDLSEVKIKYISNPAILTINEDIPHKMPLKTPARRDDLKIGQQPTAKGMATLA